MKHSGLIVRYLITFFGLAALAFAQDRPLDNIASRQYQHEIRPLRLALDGWLQEVHPSELLDPCHTKYCLESLTIDDDRIVFLEVDGCWQVEILIP